MATPTFLVCWWTKDEINALSFYGRDAWRECRDFWSDIDGTDQELMSVTAHDRVTGTVTDVTPQFLRPIAEQLFHWAADLDRHKEVEAYANVYWPALKKYGFKDQMESISNELDRVRDIEYRRRIIPREQS